MRGKVALGIACGMGLSAAAQRAVADTVYGQNFAVNSGGMTALSMVNWAAYYGNSTVATTASTGSNGSPPNAMISGGPSGPAGPQVNATTISTTTTGTTNGFVPLLSANGTYQMVAYTNEYIINTSTYSPTTFSWYAATGYAGDSQNLIIQVDGAWYASTYQITAMPTIGTVGGNFTANNTLVTTTYSTAASSWQTLTFSPGSALTLGPVLTSPLPSDNITGFGVYAAFSTNSTERTYFDTFEVNATPVPEPGSVLFAALGAAPALLRRGRRT